MLSNDPFAKYRTGRNINDNPEGDPFAKYRTGRNINDKNTLEKPSRGLAKSALRQVGRLARAGVTGVAGIADIPNLGAMGLHAAGLKDTPTFYEPVAGKAQQVFDTLTGDSLKPENKAEEYMDIIGEGLAPMVLAPLTGGASLTGVAARGLAKKGVGAAQKIANIGKATYKPTAANIAGSIGSSAALKTYIEEGGDPGIVEAILASTIGGAGARGALKAANPLNAAAELIGKATRFSPEKYAKNVEIGIPSSLSTISKSEMPARLEQIGSKLLPGSRSFEKFYKRSERNLARNLGISNPEDLVTAVENIPKHLAKTGAKGYHKRVEDIYKHREKRFKDLENAAIANKELVDVSDIIDKLEHERSLFSTDASRKSLFDKSKEGILLKQLKEAIPETSQSLESASLFKELRKQGLPDDMIKNIMKSEIGDIPSSKKGIGFHDLNKLREKALQESIDLKTPIGGGTPESARAAARSQMLAEKRYQFVKDKGTPSEFHNAQQGRKFWSSYKNEENGMSKYVAKLTGADNDVDAFNRLTSNNPKYLSIARQGLPRSEHAKLAEGIISDLGSRQGRFSINTAYTNFSKLDKKVKSEFLKLLPTQAARHNFDNTIKFIGENKRLIDKIANTSNTAPTQELANSIKRYGAAATAAATGYGFNKLLAVGLSMGGLWGGSKLWTSQRFLKRINDVLTSKTEMGKAHKLDVLFNSIGQTGRQSHHFQ